MISDAEHLFISLLAICVSSLKKHLFRSSAHFLISFFDIEFYELFAFWILTPYRTYHLQIFSRIQ